MYNVRRAVDREDPKLLHMFNPDTRTFEQSQRLMDRLRLGGVEIAKKDSFLHPELPF